MLDLRENFKNKYKSSELTCELCALHQDNQKSIHTCIKLSAKNIPIYEDIFSPKVQKQVKVSLILI